MIANETTVHKRPKMTQTLTTIGHRTAFNNELRPYMSVVPNTYETEDAFTFLVHLNL